MTDLIQIDYRNCRSRPYTARFVDEHGRTLHDVNDKAGRKRQFKSEAAAKKAAQQLADNLTKLVWK